MARMRSRASFAAGLSRRSPWQAGLCLLVAVLLLYNPFLFLAHTGTGLYLTHPVSKRATVGAGELKHFPPVSEQMSPYAALTECFGEHYVVFKAVFQSRTKVDTGRLSRAELSANLWFRPPPTV
jgi:hypothetical protein